MDNQDKNAPLIYAIGFGAFGLIVLLLLFMFVFGRLMAGAHRNRSPLTPVASPSATP